MTTQTKGLFGMIVGMILLITGNLIPTAPYGLLLTFIGFVVVVYFNFYFIAMWLKKKGDQPAVSPANQYYRKRAFWIIVGVALAAGATEPFLLMFADPDLPVLTCWLIPAFVFCLVVGVGIVRYQCN